MKINFIFNALIHSCRDCICYLRHFVFILRSSLTSWQFYSSVVKQTKWCGISHLLYASFLCVLLFQVLPAIYSLSCVQDALKNNSNKGTIQRNINHIISKIPLMHYNKQTASMSLTDAMYQRTIKDLNGDDVIIINLQSGEHLNQISSNNVKNDGISPALAISQSNASDGVVNLAKSNDLDKTKSQSSSMEQRQKFKMHFLLKIEPKHVELTLGNKSAEYLRFSYLYSSLLRVLNANTEQEFVLFDHAMLRLLALKLTQYYKHFLMMCELTLGVFIHAFITLFSLTIRCCFIYALTLIVQRGMLPFKNIMSLAIFSSIPMLFLPSGLSSICGIWTMYLIFIALKHNKKYA